MIRHQTKLGVVYIMREFVKASNKSETLHFNRRVLGFMLIEPTRNIQDRMLFLILQRDLMEASGDAAGTRVDIQDEFSFKIGVDEYGIRREGLLKQLEGFASLRSVRKLLLAMNASSSFQIMM